MHEDIIPAKVYVLVFAALCLMTVLTYGVALIDLGWANPIVALSLASAKALLVVLYFMHVRYSTRLTWLVAGSGLFWLAILFVLTLSDYLTRGWLRPVTAG